MPRTKPTEIQSIPDKYLHDVTMGILDHISYPKSKDPVTVTDFYAQKYIEIYNYLVRKNTPSKSTKPSIITDEEMALLLK